MTHALETAQDQALPGGGFLVAPVPRGGITIREDRSEEQALFAETAARFIQDQVLTRVDEIEHKAEVDVDGTSTPLVVQLTREAAELGLASLEIPEEYEGLGLDLTTSLAVSESLFGNASFAVTLGAHAGIGTLPIVYFGNEEQKQKYLPRLATAELFSCYALTEPGNGSDALNGRSTAVRSEDGTHFLLTGQKQFITNGSWADLAVVFANIDGKYSGLIVDLHAEGVSRGAEEKKMGIKGSSTTSLVFQDVKVPVENQLGEVGAGGNIALNILGVGRLKLGLSCLGTAKYALDLTIKFMAERRQFGRPIIEFDLQQGKLAECAAWIYGCDSLCYRIAGQIDAEEAKLPEGHTAADTMGVLRRFGVECAMVKIAGSETASRVLYQAVRMHGGYGFCEEYQVERLTRDNVVDTIFEGTNDVNRLVAAGGVVESAFMGSIPFLSFMDALHDGTGSESGEGYLGAEAQRVGGLKRALAFATEQVLINVGKDIRNEQQIMMLLADGLIALGTAEATLARTIQVGAGHAQAAARVAATRVILGDAEREIERVSRSSVEHVVPAGDLTSARETLERLLPHTHEDVIALKRTLAEHVTAAGRYDFE